MSSIADLGMHVMTAVMSATLIICIFAAASLQGKWRWMFVFISGCVHAAVISIGYAGRAVLDAATGTAILTLAISDLSSPYVWRGGHDDWSRHPRRAVFLVWIVPLGVASLMRLIVQLVGGSTLNAALEFGSVVSGANILYILACHTVDGVEQGPKRVLSLCFVTLAAVRAAPGSVAMTMNEALLALPVLTWGLWFQIKHLPRLHAEYQLRKAVTAAPTLHGLFQLELAVQQYACASPSLRADAQRILECLLLGQHLEQAVRSDVRDVDHSQLDCHVHEAEHRRSVANINRPCQQRFEELLAQAKRKHVVASAYADLKRAIATAVSEVGDAVPTESNFCTLQALMENARKAEICNATRELLDEGQKVLDHYRWLGIVLNDLRQPLLEVDAEALEKTLKELMEAPFGVPPGLIKECKAMLEKLYARKGLANDLVMAEQRSETDAEIWERLLEKARDLELENPFIVRIENCLKWAQDRHDIVQGLETFLLVSVSDLERHKKGVFERAVKQAEEQTWRISSPLLLLAQQHLLLVKQCSSARQEILRLLTTLKDDL